MVREDKTRTLADNVATDSLIESLEEKINESVAIYFAEKDNSCRNICIGSKQFIVVK